VTAHEDTHEPTPSRSSSRTVEELRQRVQEIIDDNLEIFGSPGKAIDQCIFESQTEADLVHYILQSDPNMRKVYSGYWWGKLTEAYNKAGPEGHRSRKPKIKAGGTRRDEDATRRAWQASNLERMNDLLPQNFDEIINMTYRQMQQAADLMKSTISRASQLMGLFEKMLGYAVPADLDTPMRDVLPTELKAELKKSWEG
jgi:hypothetical protein